MLTGGLRLSKAAQIGLLGFGDKYYATFEGSVVYMPTDWLALAYELRSKPDPYKQVPGLIGHESNWQSFAAGWVVNDHMTIAAVFGLMGNVANACEDNSVGIQLRWEF
jgi:hypothetical protein